MAPSLAASETSPSGSVVAALTAKETRLVAAIEKSEILLGLIQRKHPDFGFLVPRDILLSQGDCIVNLARLKRLRLHQQSLQSNEASTPSTELIQEIEVLLTNARTIYAGLDGGVGVPGQILVLLELGELQTSTHRPTDAMTTYAEAISHCYSIGDQSTENLLMNKLQAIQLDMNAVAHLDQVAADVQENAMERQILNDCFWKVTTANNATASLAKEHLQGIATELGIKVPLTKSGVEEIWRQITSLPRPTGSEPTTTISFETFWRWWMSETMYEYRATRNNRLK